MRFQIIKGVRKIERVKNHSELHNHNSIGSLLDGMGMPDEIMSRCDDLGLKAYAITDHGTEFALYYFAEIQNKYSAKIIYGIELYEAYNHLEQDEHNKYFHLLALAKTQKGIQALHQLTTKGEFEGKYYKPRVDLEQLKEFKDDLIIGSACLAGKINRAKSYDDAKQYALEYKEIFGDNFYLELQAHSSEDQIKANEQLMKLHYELNIPYIITSDSHYISKEDSINHSKFINVNRKNADTTITNEIYENCYLHSTNEMYEIMMNGGLTEDEVTIGLQNTNIVADLCKGQIEFHEPQLPKVEIPNPYKSQEEYFMALILQGWEDRNIEKQAEEDEKYTLQDYKERLLHEFNVIKQMNYIDYHLIVGDYMQYAVNNKIPTAPGRGSGAGSLINYLLKITNINPLKYSLIFERYLNIERISLPDIDSDFSSGRREEVFKYLQDKYGVDYVAQIINISKYTPKVAIADASKMCIPPVPMKDVNAIKEFMVDDTIDECIKNSKNNNKLQELMSSYPEMFELAKSFEGRIKTTGTNACGCVISSNPIYKYCGMKKGENGEQLLQVDKVITEKLGMVKCDVLGTTVLQIIDEVLNTQGMDFYEFMDNLSYEDKDTYDFLEKGLYYGVFQLGSYNMTKFFMKLKPKNLEDICLGISTYRPGSMKYIDKMINRKNGVEPITYDHPLLEDVLRNTYGVPVYQEQVLQMLQVLAGFNYAQADLVRRGMSKKKAEYVLGRKQAFVYGEVRLHEDVLTPIGGNGNEYEKDERIISYERAKKEYNEGDYDLLIEGCVHRDIDEQLAIKIYTDLEDFSLYGFNKSHGLAYAIITYITAYLKCHYPIEFMNTILTYANDATEITKYLVQCKDMNIKILNPDINESYLGFRIYENGIMYGIGSLYNVGEPTVKQIIKNRPYTSFQNFLDKNVFNIMKDEIKFDKSSLISLVNGGCFDTLPMYDDETEKSTREILLVKIFSNNIKQISKVSATNIPELFDNDIISIKDFPLEYEIYKLHKVITSKNYIFNIIQDDEIVTKIKNTYTDEVYSIKETNFILDNKKYKKQYDKKLENIKDNMKQNAEEYSKKINKIRILSAYFNYRNNRDDADLEFESTSFYFQKSWLDISQETYGVDEFKDIPSLDMDEVGYYSKKQLYVIVGTLTGKIKKHKEIILLTNSGIVIAKLGDILYNTVASDLSKGDKIALNGYVGNGFFRAEYYINGKSNKVKALKVI
ncbi:DNA polymerase III subunit alpha [uncultured Clostridium sp.]|uniref:DNA polymerase III subunit alpha n=1 Tax=uncultured Clostridium sp. TaxID=59620 RepID=UPI0032175031